MMVWKTAEWYVIAGLTLSWQLLLPEFFHFECKVASIFVSLLHKGVIDEYLKCITNGFTVLHVMKAILEIAHFLGLMCALSTKQLLY